MRVEREQKRRHFYHICFTPTGSHITCHIPTLRHSSCHGQMSRDLEQARCWSWVSLVLGILVLIGAAMSASGSWPIIVLEILSVLGSLTLLFAGDAWLYTAFVMLALSAVGEGIGALTALIIGIVLVSVTTGELLGLGVFLGTILLVMSVPLGALCAIDTYTAVLIRRTWASAEDKEEAAADKPALLLST